MRKHLLPLFIVLLTCVCTPALYASGETYDVWDGTTVTAVTPTSQTYIVSTAAQLAWIANQAIDFAGDTIVLTANIDLAGYKWKPIGTAATPFKGTFKGKGHLVKGFRLLDGTDGVGLFGHVAAKGSIDSLGISGGELRVASKRRVGFIAGVCDGKIERCWSMGRIVSSGKIVGGLVGELTANGTITDAYNAGLIAGSDTIGTIVGINSGKLTRVYNSGYARNGFGIVGFDKGGKYEKCYYDRKVYYMQPGAENDGIIPYDETEKMFTIFDDQAAVWSLGTTRYPVLKAFEATDAAQLSAAPMFIEKSEQNPVNHATDLTKNFTVSTDGGVTWACQDETDKQWIKISGSNVQVIRPCSDLDIYVNATLKAETRVVYMHPIRWKDFLPGSASGKYKTFCFKEEAFVSSNMAMQKAQYGWEDARYYYMMERSVINAPGDTVALDTLYNGELTPSLDFDLWLATAPLPTDKAGLFVIRRFAHDSVCVLDWVRSKGEFVYRVFEEFDPGEITDNTTPTTDTIFLPVNITIPSIKDATGGGGPITYIWQKNGTDIASSNTASLNGYTDISQPGTYTFTRNALDSANCGKNNQTAKGKYVVVVMEKFKPGKIDEAIDTLVFCTVKEAKAYTINGTAATGGAKPYHYEWYLASATDTIAIKGSNTEDLSLNLDTIKAGNTYTFVRKAEDASSFTKLTLCDNRMTIVVKKELEPGSIQDGPLPDYCAPYDATGETMVSIVVTGTTPQGENGIEYVWKRVEDGKEVANTKELNYSHPLKDITLGNTYTYVRYARNPGCEWYLSSGQATQYYGKDSYTEKTITLCKDELEDYEIKWSDGNTYKFADETVTHTLGEKDGKCTKYTKFSVKTVATPDFYIDEIASLCQNTGVLTLQLEQMTGESNMFYIRYSPDLQKYMGKKDTTGIIPESGTIVFQNLPNIGLGDCYMTFKIGYSNPDNEGTCYSEAYKVKLEVSLGGYVYSKYDRVIFVDNNPDNGAITGEKLEFVPDSYQWYRNGIKQEGQTKQYYHEDGRILNGTYHVRLTDTKGVQYRSCDVILPAGSETVNAPQYNVVYPVPVGAGQPLTLDCIGDAQIISFAGECVTHVGQVNGQTTVSAPRMPGMYYVQITTADGVMEMHKLIVK